MSLALAAGQLRSHAGRYLATVLAVAVSVAFVLASAGVLRTMTASVDGVFGLRYAHSDVVVEKLGDRTSASTAEGRREAADAETLALDRIRGLPGVRAVTVDSQTYVRMTPRDGAQRLTTATTLSTDEELRWQPLAAGRLPAAPGEVAVRADGGEPLGSVFDVRPTSSDEPTRVTVVGLLDLADQPDAKSAFPLYTVDPQVQSWAGEDGAGGDVRVAGDGTVSQEQLAERVRAELGRIPGASPATVTTGAAESADLTRKYVGDKDVYSRALVAFTVLAVAVASLVIATTFAVVFAARVREMALLRCLGASRTQVRASALLETLLVALVATGLGLVLGRVGVGVVARNAHRLGVTIPMQEVTVPDRAYALAAAVGLGMTLLTALPSVLRSTAGSPLVALRPTDVRPEPWWRRALLVALGLAVAVPAWGRMLAAVDARVVVHAGAWGVLAFLGVLAVLAGALPTVLGVLGTVFGAVLGPVGLLGARNTARSPRRTASTASAVLVGVTLTATMVTGIALLGPSVQARFVDKVPLDVAVTAREGVLPAGLADTLAGVDGVERVLPVTDMYAKDPQGRQTVLRVADPEAIREVMRRDVVLPAEGEIVLPANSPVAAGARDGDRVRFTFFSDDDARELVVRRTQDQWAITAPGSVPAWPVAQLPDGSPWPAGVEVPAQFTPRGELWLHMDPALEGPALDAALGRVRTATADADPSLAVTEAFESRRQISRTVDTVLTSTSLLLAVAVAIALVGVVNTLSLAVSERGRELALLRGVGVTRGGIRVMVLVEALLVGLAASALGVVLGVAFGGYGAAALVGADAVGDTSAPLRDVVGVGVGGVLATLLAAAATSVPAARTRVTEL